MSSPAAIADSAPRPVRFTRDEFYRLGEGGFFRGRRVERVRGELIQMAAMKEPHNCSVTLTADALRAAFGPAVTVRVQMSLALGDASDPEPDLAVVRGRARDYSDLPTTALLIVEVASSSLAYDMTVKAELYAEFGIADYWIVDLNARRLLVSRDPAPIAAGGFAYRTQRVLGPADAVSPLAAPDATVRVADLLP